MEILVISKEIMFDIDLVAFFTPYAYEPLLVYSFIIMFMTASSFGLPIPEEMTLVSAGLVAYMARNPDLFPPPVPGAEGVNLVLLCIICFIAVLGSDIFIFFIGKYFGKKLIRTKLFDKTIGQDRFNKVNKLFLKYSSWAPGIFRFTPGIRFPGHMSCGLMGIPLWKFVLVDGMAALLTVPTQVLLVAYYGEVILAKIKEFKIALLIILAVLGFIWLGNKVFKVWQAKKSKRLSKDSSNIS
jgi:membrane protein DedA with SNARE-associated domain